MAKVSNNDTLDIVERLQEVAYEEPCVKKLISEKLEQLDKMNIATQAEASKQLTVENTGLEYAMYTSGKVIYKQYLELEGCKEKLVQLGEYDEKELQNFMVKKHREEENAEKAKIVINKVFEEMRLSRKQLQQSSK